MTPFSIRGISKRWQLAPESPLAAELASELSAPLLIGQLLALRGISTRMEAANFVKPSGRQMHDPVLLVGAERAAERIIRAINNAEKIVIYGDYDVDGVTATAILFHLFKHLDGNCNVEPYIPHRISEGYGLNEDALLQLASNGTNLIISVDCGITAVKEANVLRDLPTDLIITDHHELADDLPAAYAHVHPALEGDPGYPFRGLCGAGVAFKLALQTARMYCGSTELPSSTRLLLRELLVLASIGTVADIVPLTGENRAIVYFGLQRIKNTAFTGLNALIKASGLDGDRDIDETRIGFVLGPRLNAIGRLGHAREACKLLTDATPSEARDLSEKLNRLNHERQQIQKTISEQAINMVLEEGLDDPFHRIIVLSHPEWHSGVIGIVASRVVEEFGKPAILMQERDGQLVGSARSIDGFDLHEALSASSDLFDTFGGHAMAAGLSLPVENLEQFRDEISTYARIHIHEDDLTPTINLDARLSLDRLDLKLIEQMNLLAPFGRDNHRPAFLVEDVQVTDLSRMGADKTHLSLSVSQNGTTVRCVGWRKADLVDQIARNQRVDLAVYAETNTFRDNTTVQLQIIDVALRDQNAL